MRDYIEKTLGFKTDIKPWTDQNQLPVYLRNKREYFVLSIEGIEALLIKISNDSFSLPAFQSQLSALCKYTTLPVILLFEQLTFYQRQVLLRNRIPFIVPGTQFYVPFMGISLYEHFTQQAVRSEKLTAAAQAILLYLIYNSTSDVHTQIELSAKLNMSTMNVSRGIRELESLSLIIVEPCGKYNKVRPVSYGKELYDLSKEYMQTPIQKRIYVSKETSYMDFPIAGEEALSKQSMLNPPSHPIRALHKKASAIISKEQYLDPNWTLEKDFMEIELWKYDPNLFVSGGMVDIISLALSLKDLDDERIEEQIDELFEEVEW